MLIGLIGGGLAGDSVGDRVGIALPRAVVLGTTRFSHLCRLLAACSAVSVVRAFEARSARGAGLLKTSIPAPSAAFGGGDRVGRRAACAYGDWKAGLEEVLPRSVRVALLLYAVVCC